MKKNIILLIASLLIVGSLLSGCTQEGYTVSVVPQKIGDEVTYTLSLSTTTTSTDPFSSEPSIQSNTMNGTTFSKVNGTKTVKDGFGVEKEAVELYTKMIFEIDSEAPLPTGYELSTIVYSYMDLESKFPIKSVSQMNIGFMNMTYEFYISEKMYEFLSTSFSTSGMPSTAGLSPNDISSAFEGKTIRKGDTGTITITNITITWTAVDYENVKGYDCIKIQFNFPIPVSSETISATFDYTVWLTDSFPSLIKMSGTVTTITLYGSEYTYQASTVIDMILESSTRGHTSITWGSADPSFPDTNFLGEYEEWDVIPPLGSKDTTISYGPEEAVAYGQTNSSNLSSYMTSHPDAYVTTSKYERKNTTETWELTFGHDALQGYEIKLSHNDTETNITSEESKVFSTSAPSKSSLCQTLLTFSGCEHIFSQYKNIDSSSDIQIQFTADISHQSSTSGSDSGFSSSLSEMFPHSLYMITVGDIQQEATAAIIDAETGQLIMLISMQSYMFGY